MSRMPPSPNPAKWGYGPTIAGPYDEAFLGLGPIGTIAAVLGLAYGLITKKKEIKALSIFFAVFFILAAFLSHERSTFIWKALPFIEFFQFPWRFILLVSFCSSILGTIFVSAFKGKIYWAITLILLITTYAFYGSFYQPKNWFAVSDAEKLSGDNLERQITASIYDYLPKSASRAPTSRAPSSLIPIEGEIETLSFIRGTNWYKVEAESKKGGSLAALPTYEFPTWNVKVNGQVVENQKNGELGLVSFKLPEGKATITAKLDNPWFVKLADITSLIGLALVIYLIGYEKVFIKVRKE